MHGNVIGQVFALFVIAIAAAEVGVGLAIVLLIYRNRRSIALDEVDLYEGPAVGSVLAQGGRSAAEAGSR